ncbi:uncharacterized protein PRCAT00005211001 [Priceomyces carsonii]|uniref:uncharacterized protein n=1 Tax=Priceomyces carsonii TaxID=28549 RepID=UPI002EDB68B4|nr:unnamed protein product [Priceomyces carsonii]
MILRAVTSLVERKDQNTDLSFLDIAFLTFEAVLEVVIICVAGFISAKLGLLNTQNQKVISQLNVDLFTPCLVFSKLASSLSFQKMIDIIIIPVFFCMLTGVSYLSSKIVNNFFHLNNPELDFVTAMSVFSNSNSLPVSLTLSLAYTLPDLLWEDIDDDNSDRVASRGILYLLIFQQLGQVLRWSWGYNTLLRRRSPEELTLYSTKSYDEDEARSLLIDSQPNSPTEVTSDNSYFDEEIERVIERDNEDNHSIKSFSSPVAVQSYGVSQYWISFKNSSVVQSFLKFMNPPLYAMLISVIVASIPFLQDQMFNKKDSFVNATLTASITQLGSVSIPLILIVLGSNLYPSKDVPSASKHYNRIVAASVLSRMILPSFVMLPFISLCVKFIKISILDDPIFLIVAFILTISPPAIQLSQITQINGIYQKEMGGVLFWGYVILTLPTTIFIVVTSLEVIKWAK